MQRRQLALLQLGFSKTDSPEGLDMIAKVRCDNLLSRHQSLGHTYPRIPWNSCGAVGSPKLRAEVCRALGVDCHYQMAQRTKGLARILQTVRRDRPPDHSLPRPLVGSLCSFCFARRPFKIKHNKGVDSLKSPRDKVGVFHCQTRNTCLTHSFKPAGPARR